MAIGFIALAKKERFSMPQFYSKTVKHRDIGFEKLTLLRKSSFIFFIVLFFALSGGIIRVFQSMSMTFGLCGPLKLDAHRYLKCSVLVPNIYV